MRIYYRQALGGLGCAPCLQLVERLSCNLCISQRYTCELGRVNHAGEIIQGGLLWGGRGDVHGELTAILTQSVVNTVFDAFLAKAQRLGMVSGVL